MSLIKGKVALVVGGHRGIGYECCASLLMNGIKGLMLVGRDEKKGNEATCELETYGDGDIRFIKTDIAVARNFQNVFETTIKTFNQLDMFIHCSETINEYHWENAIKLNLTSVLRGSIMAMKHYLPKYKSGKEGIIINLSSVAGLQPMASLPIYSSTKHGIIGLVRSLGSDYQYEQYQCRVMGLCPGLIEEIPLFAKNQPQGIDLDLLDEEICHWPKQSGDKCGKTLIKIINTGKNGSIWICEGPFCYQWKFPNRFELFATHAKEIAIG
ncbi:15-hydroxyprostaglandin dehydrogenase [NAD(+)]-like [Onthophagus taurus]|uniref:15-hydroxyprostaglandin dehydrogenase [NAD(+)]-like n=1 Tax=Onthophagus taurus TaxID=166361 RepID=UPI0039BEBB1C